jgi:hypothetical protein
MDKNKSQEVATALKAVAEKKETEQHQLEASQPEELIHSDVGYWAK